MRSKYNKGFTLVELLIASILTTIIISTVGIIIYRVAKLNDQLTETQRQTDEIRMIDKNIEVFIKNVNKEGYDLKIDNNKVSFTINDTENAITINDRNIVINDKTITFNKIETITLTKENNHLLSFAFTVGERTVVKEYYVVGRID